MKCPHCRDQLVRNAVDQSIFWTCISCSGHLTTWDSFKTKARKDLVQEIVRASSTASCPSSRSCPVCQHAMKRFKVNLAQKSWELDMCSSCKLLWFDRYEYEDIERTPVLKGEVISKPSPTPDGVQVKSEVNPVNVKIAKEILGEVAETFPFRPETHHYILALMGMPIEHNSANSLTRPWLTWALVLLSSFVTLFSWYVNPHLAEILQFDTTQPFRFLGLNFLTYFFVHASVTHLLGNMYFLLILGDNVEDFLGHFRYAGLLIAGTVFGAILDVFFDPRSLPLVGASAGISAIIVFYALQFPRAKLILFFFFRWLPMSIFVWALIWFGTQILGAWMQVSGLGHVSYLGHVGGILVGFVFWLLYRGRILNLA